MRPSASSRSPAIACSAASGCRVRATASGLCATASPSDRQRAIASGTGIGPCSAADARQPVMASVVTASPARCRVLGRARPVVVGRGGPALDPGVDRAQVQRATAAEVVAAVAEHAERVVGDGARRVAVLAGLQAHERALDAGARPELVVGRRVLDRAGHRVVGIGEPARLEQRGAEAREQLRAPGRERGGALQQARAGRGVAAAQRGLAGGLQPRGRARRQLVLARAVAPQLAQQAARLREVMAHGLVLHRPGRGLLVEARRGAPSGRRGTPRPG